MKKLIALLLSTFLCVSLFAGCVLVEKPNYFEGDCGISILATLGAENSYLSYPYLNISMLNNTSKEIAAVKLYLVSRDVYGDETNRFMSGGEILFDKSIPAGKTGEITERLLDDSVKAVDIYVYSVYFADGTEWGNRNAKRYDILNNAPKIEVKLTES